MIIIMVLEILILEGLEVLMMALVIFQGIQLKAQQTIKLGKLFNFVKFMRIFKLESAQNVLMAIF